MLSNPLIAFDFWGAGNLGDDLMLDGFLRGIEHCGVAYEGRLSSLSAHDIGSQRTRFPRVRWVDSRNQHTLFEAIARAELLLGVGDTPFQVTCGDWFLRHLSAIMDHLDAGTEAIFIGVGAEEEVLERAPDFVPILQRVSRCSTRDAFSCAVLRRLSAQAATCLSVGGDLAHISLEQLAAAVSPNRQFALGVVLGIDTLSGADLGVIRGFLQALPGPVAFITQDCRDEPGWRSALRAKLIPRRPDYAACTVAELVLPFAECATILTSRLHGILAAAWMGCRVAAIGRSSKVIAIAEKLGVPLVKPPLGEEVLRSVMVHAIHVPRDLLVKCRDEAYEGLEACRFW
jgi:polysaccharide pyruvyl transferase WcaK-like protein